MYSPLAYRNAWRAARGRPEPFGPVADPAGAGYLNTRVDLSDGLTLTLGVVVDSIAYLNAYRVQLEGLAPPSICPLAGSTGFGIVGARALDTLPPGAVVMVARRPGVPGGTILAALPPPDADPALALADMLAMAGRSGFAADAAHRAPLAADAPLSCWAAGRPRDATTAGEWGAIFETGVRVAADSFMAQLAADEATGVFAFYHDQLLRVAGVNLQEFSAAHDRAWGDDEGECLAEAGWTPYPWERLGLYAPGDATRAVPASDAQDARPYLAPREPACDDQVAFHRRLWVGGYAGQGGKDLVLAPPAAPPPAARLSAPATPAADPVALLEEQRTLAGHYLLRAAGGLHLARQATIPAPRRLRRPEDATGDAAANYRPAGVGPGGDPHRVTAALAPPAADAGADPPPPGQPAAAVLDELARLRNWEGEHALAYHARDWRVPEESETAAAAGAGPPPIDALATTHALPPAAPTPLVVDARYGPVDYTPAESGIHLLPDGSVVIRDGYGSSLVMAGGHIELCPAGDLVARPGRSLVALAGRDVNLRARGSLEASAATGDLRLKAEKNLHALAGNSGAGGLLLESRGADAYDYADKVGTDVVSGGVQVRSAGAVAMWAGNYYLRARDAGTILLDADGGNGAIVQWCGSATRYLAEGAQDYFGTPTAVRAVNTYSEGGATVAGGLAALGDCTLSGRLTTGGDVSIVGGHVYSDQAGDYQGQVGGYGPTGARALKAQLAAEGQAARQSARGGQDAFAALRPTFYAAGTPGDPDTMAAVGFSFRSTAQYGAKGYVAWEASWQQMARLGGLTLGAWTEPPVMAANAPTYPYPGKAAWVDGENYIEQDLGLYDAEKGVAVDRGAHRADYEAPAYRAPARKAADGRYAIVDPA